MISRDVSVAKRSLTFHSQLICNQGLPMGRGSREEKWRDTRVVSHASVTRTGTNYNLNDASCGEKRVPAAILISPSVCHSVFSRTVDWNRSPNESSDAPRTKSCRAFASPSILLLYDLENTILWNSLILYSGWISGKYCKIFTAFKILKRFKTSQFWILDKILSLNNFKFYDTIYIVTQKLARRAIY